MQESWKAIPNFEGFYEVSSLGRIRSIERIVGNRWGTEAGRIIPERIKAFSRNSQGYCSVHLYIAQKMTKFYVHRLVATAFIKNPDELPQVNHLDGNKENNAAINLEWCSGTSNCIHALATELYESARGEAISSAVLTEASVVEIRAMAASGHYHKDIAEIFGVGRKAITKIVNRQRWKHVV
ncbi:NUMOD4 domain-containing protein [Pseudomonas piscis]|uniref:NUMOD4 domain-containing protein n=1 Tax=Pseudomonas piscis TaxID=2614538 RepID=UPI0039A686AF